MKRPLDPPRLCDEASEAPALLRRAFLDARSELPSADDLGCLAAKLGPLLGPPPEGAPPDGGSPPPDGGAPATPPTAAPPVTALPAGGIFPWSAAISAVTAVAAAAAVALGVARGWPRERAEPPVLHLAVKRAAVAVAAVAEGAHLSPSKDPPAEGTVMAAEPAKGAPGARSSARAAAAPAVQGKPPAVQGKPPRSRSEAFKAEATLLWRARSALARDPASALALTAEHARLFPAGTMAEEREVLAILAMARLDRGAEARARASELLRRRPDSVHRGQIEDALR
ncbi:hypothetical protein [Sorangium sp. So ce1078]|uniref:hypothetical protein n=1 Tax=Sorangium sp. So ce1078 TaxID=3133329 RepID=UPI003F5EECA0